MESENKKIAFDNEELAQKTFSDLTIHVRKGEDVKKYYFHRFMLCDFPKILEQIKDQVWTIDNIEPDYVHIFLFDLYRAFKKTLQPLTYSVRQTIELHKLAVKYQVPILTRFYFQFFYQCPLTNELHEYLTSINAPQEMIINCYINCPSNKISPELVKNFDNELWKGIINNTRMISYNSLWNYCWRFMTLEEIEESLHVRDYRSIFSHDLKFIRDHLISNGTNVDARIAIVARYVIDRLAITNCGIPPKPFPKENISPTDEDGIDAILSNLKMKKQKRNDN